MNDTRAEWLAKLDAAPTLTPAEKYMQQLLKEGPHHMNDTTEDPVREYTAAELDDMVQGYLECALWASTDYDHEDPNEEDEGEPFQLDDRYGIDDIDEETVRQAREDCAAMLSLPDAGEYMRRIDTHGEGGGPAAWYGHDFWLTRDGHGAGYWDRGLGDLGDRLTAMAKPYGEVSLYVGDDGKIHS